MNIYLLSQSENTGYDTYDSCVVAAPDEETAMNIHPSYYGGFDSGAWATSPENVHASLIGEAVPEIEKGVILASFNAG